MQLAAFVIIKEHALVRAEERAEEMLFVGQIFHCLQCGESSRLDLVDFAAKGVPPPPIRHVYIQSRTEALSAIFWYRYMSQISFV